MSILKINVATTKIKKRISICIDLLITIYLNVQIQRKNKQQKNKHKTQLIKDKKKR